MKILLLIFILAYFLANLIYAQSVNFIINMKDSLLPISPYIYGTNLLTEEGENWTARRLGGNRLTGYNWENNASNAGSDWFQQSDDYMTSIFGITNENVPGITTTTFHDQSIQMGAYSLITLQMAGYVANDKNGIVQPSEVAPSPRWAEVKFEKGSAFTYPPDTTDHEVYMDAYINFLINKYGASNTAIGIKGYELDNEPSLWCSTHPLLHPDTTSCAEIVQKGIALSQVVKKFDAKAEIFGPALFGFSAYTTFQWAHDWNSIQQKNNYSWFIDYYLDQMKKAETTTGKRLLDVLDVHWYPEAIGAQRVINASATTAADDTARINCPRTLWDSPAHYIENSWIGQYGRNHLPLIPNLIHSINKYYPGTKLAFTEFNYGGENDISGAIAISDVIGIFAKYGIYLGAYWGLQSTSPFISAAYKMYRNYDGNNSAFGDYYVPSQSSDSVDCCLYASLKSTNSEIHLIVINKSYSNNILGNFSVATTKKILSGRVWLLDSNGPQIKEINAINNIINNSFTYNFPLWSVCHIVLQTSDLVNVAETKAKPDKFSLRIYPNPFNPTCRIEYNSSGSSNSKIDIYSMEGSLIKSFDNLFNSGYVFWDGTNNNNGKVASGVYFAILRNANRVIASEKIVLLK